MAWDEVEGGRRTRPLHAYACPANQKPDPPPKSLVEKATWPTTVQEAGEKILATTREESERRFAEPKRKTWLAIIWVWGMGILNQFGLERGNTALLASCGGGDRLRS